MFWIDKFIFIVFDNVCIGGVIIFDNFNGVNFGIVVDNFFFWNVVLLFGFVFYFCF